MTDWNQFEHGHGMEPMTCEVCEAMCLDAVDGTLTAAEEAAFERHVAGCVMCAEQLAEARRGAAWMEMLKGHRPEPPAALLTRILAETSGTAAPIVASVAVPQIHLVPQPMTTSLPPAGAGKLLQFRRKAASSFSFGGGQTYFQPRLAMTAAMAFFSIALTMNLSGIRPSDLRPGALHRTMADAGANAARTFQSFRVVNQVESRVSEMRSDDLKNDGRDTGGPFGESSDTPKQAAPANGEHKPEVKPDDAQAPANGSSELVLPGQLVVRTDALAVQKGA